MISTSQKVQLKKTISWTLLSMSITILVGWYVVGLYLPQAFTIGVTVGVIDRLIKIPAYYTHERIWHKIYKKLTGK